MSFCNLIWLLCALVLWISFFSQSIPIFYHYANVNISNFWHFDMKFCIRFVCILFECILLPPIQPPNHLQPSIPFSTCWIDFRCFFFCSSPGCEMVSGPLGILFSEFNQTKSNTHTTAIQHLNCAVLLNFIASNETFNNFTQLFYLFDYF